MCAVKDTESLGRSPNRGPPRLPGARDAEAGDAGGRPPAQRGAVERVGPCASGDPLKTLGASAPDSETSAMSLSWNSAASRTCPQIRECALKRRTSGAAKQESVRFSKRDTCVPGANKHNGQESTSPNRPPNVVSGSYRGAGGQRSGHPCGPLS